MGFIDLASLNSLWKGIDYYQIKKVKNIKKINDNEYDSVVLGNKEYNVHIDIDHPRKSSCTCPFAKGRRVICKHMVATYFTIHPEEAERLIKEQEEYEKDEERRYKEKYDRVSEYVESLTEDEAKALLIGKLMEEWDDRYGW